MSAPLHLLRGFVQWTDRRRHLMEPQPIKTIEATEVCVKYIADRGFDRFCTWTSRRPERGAELKGGSVYFVGGPKRNQTLFRMPFIGIYEDGYGYEIVMRSELIRVRQDFVGKVRGWRYLEDKDAPPDLPAVEIADIDMPETVAAELKKLGLA